MAQRGLSPKGEWTEPVETEGEHYTVVSQIEDAQTCFNVNNLLAADPTPAVQTGLQPLFGRCGITVEIVHQLLVNLFCVTGRNAAVGQKLLNDARFDRFFRQRPCGLYVQTAGALPEKPVKARIVEQLLTDSGISAGDAEEIYQQLMDYLDGDTTTAKEGLETGLYRGGRIGRQQVIDVKAGLGILNLAHHGVVFTLCLHRLCPLPFGRQPALGHSEPAKNH